MMKFITISIYIYIYIIMYFVRWLQKNKFLHKRNV